MKVYEMKGKVLEMIQNLNRVAKNAFDGKAELRGTFNKEILKRATGGKKAPAPEPTPAPRPVPLNGVSSPPPA